MTRATSPALEALIAANSAAWAEYRREREAYQPTHAELLEAETRFSRTHEQIAAIREAVPVPEILQAPLASDYAVRVVIQFADGTEKATDLPPLEYRALSTADAVADFYPENDPRRAEAMGALDAYTLAKEEAVRQTAPPELKALRANASRLYRPVRRAWNLASSATAALWRFKPATPEDTFAKIAAVLEAEGAHVSANGAVRGLEDALDGLSDRQQLTVFADAFRGFAAALKQRMVTISGPEAIDEDVIANAPDYVRGPEACHA